MRINGICVKALFVTSFFIVVACSNNGSQSSEEGVGILSASDTIEIPEGSNLIGKLKTEKVTL